MAKVMECGDGVGYTINWDSLSTPFGIFSVGFTEKGLCFIQPGTKDPKDRWPQFKTERFLTDAQKELVQSYLLRRDPFLGRVHMIGTPFQKTVWQLAMAIPRGEIVTYGQLAMRLGKKGYARAVGAALSQNPMMIVVPCHRVVGRTGQLTGFRWGLNWKEFLLDDERKVKSLDPTLLV